MLPSRGVLRAAPSSRLGKKTFLPTPTSNAFHAGRVGAPRQFATNFQRGNVGIRRSNYGTDTILRSSPLGASAVLLNGLSSRSLLSSRQQARYASTEPSTATTEAAREATSGVTSTPIDISGSDLLDMPEKIGYLKAMGLDYGIGPASTMQWLMEHIYVYTGLPWWATIAATALLIRLAIFKPSLTAAETSNKLQELRKNPRFADATKRMQEAGFVTNDKAAMMEARNELTRIRKASGISMWKTFVPMVNVPIAFGMLRLLRGMAALPVPSLETGGALWFPDLTIPDPTFILPIASSALLYFVMRMNIPYMAPQQAKIMGIVSLVMAPVSTLVTIYFPAGLQFFFLVTGVLQYVQTWLFYQPWLRRWANLAPLKPVQSASPSQPQASPFSAGSGSWQAPRTISTTATPTPAASESSFSAISSSLKDGVKMATDKFGQKAKSNKKEESLRQATAYEDRRALEEEEKFHARRQERELRRRERQQQRH